MDIKEFVIKFADQFDDTPIEEFTEDTYYKEMDEWSSLTVLGIIALVKEEFGKTITGKEIRNCETIKDLFNHIQSL